MTEKPSPARRSDQDSPETVAENRTRGEQRLRSRRAAIHRIRVKIALGSVCLFLLCWLTIFGVLVEGKDPALSAKAHRDEAHVSNVVKATSLSGGKSSSASKAKVTSKGSQSSDDTEAASSSGASETDIESSQSTSGSSVTPMTTSQS